mgnify:CR=1 FL=1
MMDRTLRQTGIDRTEPAMAPADVFYVVGCVGPARKREHRTSSLLYETRSQAEAERARLSHANPTKNYSVWKHTTHIEPPEWLSDVVMADGTVIHPPR